MMDYHYVHQSQNDHSTPLLFLYSVTFPRNFFHSTIHSTLSFVLLSLLLASLLSPPIMTLMFSLNFPTWLSYSIFIPYFFTLFALSIFVRRALDWFPHHCVQTYLGISFWSCTISRVGIQFVIFILPFMSTWLLQLRAGFHHNCSTSLSRDLLVTCWK